MIDLTHFSLTHIIRNLQEINPAIQLDHPRPFPKEKARWLSCYRFQPQYPVFSDDGAVRGGLSQFVASLIDFSLHCVQGRLFVRSIVADAYSSEGGRCYDPVSLFLLDLCRLLDGNLDIKAFCRIVHDAQRGKLYRALAGCNEPWIPCQATFTHFRARLGESRYLEIFHALVTLLEKLGLVTYRILATDGTLFPTAARYHGCHCFDSSCESIRVDNVIEKVHDRVLYRIQNPAQIITGKPCHVAIECPQPKFPEEVKRPQIDILAFTLDPAPEVLSVLDINNLKSFGVEDRLTPLGLTLNFPKSNVQHIAVSSLFSEPSNSFFFRCPKLPHDTTARIGVRRHPRNPDRKEKIFGYNAIIATSIEPQLGLEFPVGCITIAGNAEESNQFIPLHDQIRHFHPAATRLHLADAKYDDEHNYIYARDHQAIPLIDYNPRRENLSREAVLARGYDRNGWPFVPYCKILTRPNGYDQQARRLSFACFKQCTRSSCPEHLELYRQCPHRANSVGFATHVPVVRFPRLILEIPRGSDRFKQLHKLRSAAERTNSTLKSDLAILDHPDVMSINASAPLSLMAVTTVLLSRLARFVIDITIQQRKLKAAGTPLSSQHLSAPEVPAHLKPFLAVS